MEVGLLFHSFHNAGNRDATGIKDLMLAILIVRAADNQMWISASNSSKRYSPLSACIVRPDGSMVRSRRNVAGIVIEDYPKAELGWTYDNRKNGVKSALDSYKKEQESRVDLTPFLTHLIIPQGSA